MNSAIAFTYPRIKTKNKERIKNNINENENLLGYICMKRIKIDHKQLKINIQFNNICYILMNNLFCFINDL